MIQKRTIPQESKDLLAYFKEIEEVENMQHNLFIGDVIVFTGTRAQCLKYDEIYLKWQGDMETVENTLKSQSYATA